MLALVLASPAASVAAAPARHGSTGQATVTTSPPSPAAVPSGDDPYSDPSRELGATSPSCRYALDAVARRSCRASGSVVQPHPLSSYGLDVRSGFSLTDPGKTFMSALQSLGAGLWMALLYGLKGVLLLLEWTFSLDLTNAGMPAARRTLANLHDRVFGDSWLLLAISLTGVWGIWRGLVQQKTVETFAGLSATVALIVLALVLISRPAETVGRAAQIANDGGMSVLAAGTGGDPAHGRQALAAALGRVFASTVRDPWCALEFGSVDYCDRKLRDRAHPSNAELWLQYPAQSWQRGRLHELMRADGGGGFSVVGAAKDIIGLGGDDRKLPDATEELVRKAPEQASMQGAGGTFPRLALLGVITVGLLGVAALLAWLGLRLLLAAGLGVVLLLVAPAMLIAPALGERGRATFIAWGQRLIGAVLAKLVFAVFLTVVLAAGSVFAAIDMGWFGTWLLQAGFWWGIFLKRHEVVGFVSAGTPRSEGTGAGQAVSQGYYAWMLGRGLRQTASRALDPARAGLRTARTHVSDGQVARRAATQELARERLDEHGTRALGEQDVSAREVTTGREDVEQELRAVDRRLRGHDETAAAARAGGLSAPAPSLDDRKLLAHRQSLRQTLSDPAVREADQAVRHVDRNRALTGEVASQRDLDVYRARRSRELDQSLPEDDHRHLRAAGVAPGDFDAAGPDEQERLREHVRAHLEQERALHAAAGKPASGRVAATEWLDPEAVRARSAELHAERRAERRRERLARGPRGSR